MCGAENKEGMSKAKIPPQKSLVLIFKIRDVLGDTVHGFAVWYWPAHEVVAWLAPRKELFPGVSSQELVSMALLPEDAKAEIVEALGDLPKGGSLRDWRMLDGPRFDVLSASCAICVVEGGVFGCSSPAAKQAMALFSTRVDRVLSGSMRDESGCSEELAPESLEQGLRAAYDRSRLLDGLGPAKRSTSRRPPGL